MLAPSPSGFALLALLFGATLFAGQLFIESFGLHDVAARGETVAVGTIREVKPPKSKKSRESTIVLDVEEVHGGVSSVFQKGNAATLEVYGGVIWDDPRKSPIERRLDGSVGATKGARVIAVPRASTLVDLMPATPENLHAVSVLWDAAVRSRWLASGDEVLEKALSRNDLAPLAVAELARRGTLTPAQILAGSESFAYEHVTGLEPAARRRFLDEALPLARQDPKRRDQVFRLATADVRPETVGALVPLVELYDPAADARHWGDVHLALVSVVNGIRDGRFRGPLDLSRFAPFLATYETHRPDYRSSDDDLKRITAYFDDPAKVALASGLLASAHTSTFARGEVDLFLLAEAARLAREAPSPSLLAAVAKVDPGVPKVRGTKEMAMGWLLEIGIAIATTHPAEKARVAAVLDPMLARGVPAERETLARYRAAVQ